MKCAFGPPPPPTFQPNSFCILHATIYEYVDIQNGMSLGHVHVINRKLNQCTIKNITSLFCDVGHAGLHISIKWWCMYVSITLDPVHTILPLWLIDIHQHYVMLSQHWWLPTFSQCIQHTCLLQVFPELLTFGICGLKIDGEQWDSETYHIFSIN